MLQIEIIQITRRKPNTVKMILMTLTIMNTTTWLIVTVMELWIRTMIISVTWRESIFWKT